MSASRRWSAVTCGGITGLGQLFSKAAVPGIVVWPSYRGKLVTDLNDGRTAPKNVYDHPAQKKRAAFKPSFSSFFEERFDTMAIGSMMRGSSRLVAALIPVSIFSISVDKCNAPCFFDKRQHQVLLYSQYEKRPMLSIVFETFRN